MKIQQLVFPNYDITAPTNMYYRVEQEDDIYFNRTDKYISLKTGKTISFDSYFNIFPIKTWKKCDIKDLYLTLCGNGKIDISFGLHRYHCPTKWIANYQIELQKNGSKIDIPFWNKLDDGLLFIKIKALSDIVLNNGFFSTNSLPETTVKLGIVITHFNRKKYVLPAIKRIKYNLLNDKDFIGKIQLVVVDNSQNITEEEARGVVVIKNKNYGGSGGFTRGLLYLEDNKYTHCLFMDDDGSCEIESIRRIYVFYSLYKGLEPYAISGTLLLENKPNIIHEKGAIFDKYHIQSLKNGLNMSNIFDILKSEIEEPNENYGAWCFFGFDITDIKNYSFPFFVRGDDILFSIQNKLKILTMPGVAVWIEDFCKKESPLTRYLGLRSTLIDRILEFNLDKQTLVKIFTHSYLLSLLSYDYASAQAKIMAIKDILKGPKVFLNDMDASTVRKKISSISAPEKLNPCTNKNWVIRKIRKENKIRRIFRKLTINGLLIPSLFLKKSTVYQIKSYNSNLKEIFMYKKVYYHEDISDTGYLAIHNKKKIICSLINYIKTLILIYKKFDSVKYEFIKQKEYMTSRGFWINALK